MRLLMITKKSPMKGKNLNQYFMFYKNERICFYSHLEQKYQDTAINIILKNRNGKK